MLAFCLPRQTLFLLLAFLIALPASVGAAPEIEPSQILVKYKSTVSPARASAIRAQVPVLAHERLDALGITRLFLQRGADLKAALRLLRADPGVAYAEPNTIRRPIFTPNDPAYASSQYGPQIIQAPQAWNLTLGRAGVVIAIIDSGVDGTHPEFSGRLLAGIDDAVYAAGTTPTGAQHDGLGHGTHVAGIAAAAINNGVGIAGIAGADTILPVKVFGDRNSADDAEIAKAIRDAADAGAAVINMSLGGEGTSQTMQDAVDYAWARNVVIVAAAGNSGGRYPNANGDPFYPAGANHVVAVAATGNDDGRASFSSYGAYVAVAAPGAGIYSTYPGGYANLSGTSMASPHVAGVAGLAFAYAPNATNAQIVAALKSGADKVGPYAYDANGRNDYYGNGRINAYKTLLAFAPPAAPTNLTATAGDGQVALSWTAPAGATGYKIYRSLSSGSGFAQVGTGTTTTYTDSGLTNGTKYFYLVTAVNALGESAASNEASATPTVAVMTVTGLFSTGLADNGAALADGAADPHYTLTRGPVVGSAFVTLQNGFPVANPWLPDTAASKWLSAQANQNGNFEPPGTYVYQTTFMVSGSTSGLSITGRMTADDYVSDVRLNGVSLRLSARGFSSWTAINLTSGFILGANTLEFVVQNDGGSNNPSGLRVELSRPGPPAPPAAPTNLTATAADRQIMLMWNPTSGAANYNVYRATTAGGEDTTPIATGVTTASFTDTGLMNGTTYYYKVAAVNSAGRSPLSNEASATPSNNIPPTGLNLGFETPSLGAGNFQYTPANASWTFTGWSGISANASGFTSANPNAPEGSQAAVLQMDGAFSQTLTGWQSATGYKITFSAAQRTNYQSSRQTLEVFLDNVSLGRFTPASNGYADLSTAVFTTTAGAHILRFVGLNPNGGDNTAFVDNVRITLANVTAPETPTNLTATPDDGQITLAWNPVGGAASYNVYRGTTAGGEGATPIATGVTTASFTDTGLTNGTTYFYKVAAVNVAGTSGLSSEASATPRISILPSGLNLGFETPSLGGGNFQYGPANASWTFTSGGGISANASGFTSANPNAPEGSQAAILQQGGSFSQSLTGWQSATGYKITFAAAQRANYQQSFQQFEVFLDNVSLGRFTPASNGYADLSTAAFTTTAGAHTLRFVGLNPNGGDNTAFVDNIRISAP